MDFKLTTPVAFIVFNRPDVSLKVFERIRRAQPTKLFFISDGARDNKPGEAEKVQQCRAIKDMVDWKCKVYTNFSEKNMGCKDRMYSGISWVFENVEEAIILEDDCLPSMSFFRFCQELLKKYRNDTRIVGISGINHDTCEDFEESYCFQNGFGCWGWATWRRAWNLMDIDMKSWKKCREKEYLKKLYSVTQYIYMTNELQMTYEERINSWAYRFLLSVYMNNGLSIVPKINMVRNIGFGADSTHTANPFHKDGFYMDEEMDFPLVHPEIMFPLNKYSEYKPNPSAEEISLELQNNIAMFENLIRSNEYSKILEHFKRILKDSKSPMVHPIYVQYLAYGYLMLNDFEHALMLLEEILDLNVLQPQSFLKFVNIFLSKQKFEEAFLILDKILSKVPGIDNNSKINIFNLVQAQRQYFSPEKYPNITKLLS